MNTGVGSLSLLQEIFPTDPGIEPESPALQADSLSAELPRKQECVIFVIFLAFFSQASYILP